MKYIKMFRPTIIFILVILVMYYLWTYHFDYIFGDYQTTSWLYPPRITRNVIYFIGVLFLLYSIRFSGHFNLGKIRKFVFIVNFSFIIIIAINSRLFFVI